MTTNRLQPVALLQHCPTCSARHIGLCQAVSEKDLESVEKHNSGSRRLEVGQHLFHEGELGGGIYILIDGWVMLYQLLPDGRRQILEFLLPGAVIGFRPDRRAPVPHSAQCVTSVTVCVFSDDQFSDVLDEHPEVAMRLARICARTHLSLHQHLTSLGRRTARERTAHFLLEIYVRLIGTDRTGAGKPVTIPLTQEQFGDALGLSRVRVNRVLHSFSEAGLIGQRRGMIELRNPEALAEIAGIQLPEQLPIAS